MSSFLLSKNHFLTVRENLKNPIFKIFLNDDFKKIYEIKKELFPYTNKTGLISEFPKLVDDIMDNLISMSVKSVSYEHGNNDFLIKEYKKIKQGAIMLNNRIELVQALISIDYQINPPKENNNYTIEEINSLSALKYLMNSLNSLIVSSLPEYLSSQTWSIK